MIYFGELGRVFYWRDVKGLEERVGDGGGIVWGRENGKSRGLR